MNLATVPTPCDKSQMAQQQVQPFHRDMLMPPSSTMSTPIRLRDASQLKPIRGLKAPENPKTPSRPVGTPRPLDPRQNKNVSKLSASPPQELPSPAPAASSSATTSTPSKQASRRTNNVVRTPRCARRAPAVARVPVEVSKKKQLKGVPNNPRPDHRECTQATTHDHIRKPFIREDHGKSNEEEFLRREGVIFDLRRRAFQRSASLAVQVSANGPLLLKNNPLQKSASMLNKADTPSTPRTPRTPRPRTLSRRSTPAVPTPIPQNKGHHPHSNGDHCNDGMRNKVEHTKLQIGGTHTPNNTSRSAGKNDKSARSSSCPRDAERPTEPPDQSTVLRSNKSSTSIENKGTKTTGVKETKAIPTQSPASKSINQKTAGQASLKQGNPIPEPTADGDGGEEERPGGGAWETWVHRKREEERLRREAQRREEARMEQRQAEDLQFEKECAQQNYRLWLQAKEVQRRKAMLQRLQASEVVKT